MPSTRLPLLALVGSLSACLAPGADPDDDVTGTATEPLYAVQSLIFGDEGSWTYVSALPSLDTVEAIALDDAREFSNYAPADAWAGSIYVGSGDAPTLTRFSVSDAGDWTESGSVSFANFTSTPLEGTVFVDDTTAFVPIDTTDHVVWNPTDLTIGGTVGAPPEIPHERDGLQVWRGYGHEIRDGLLFQPYYFSDATFHAYTQTSQIAVIDTATQSVVDVLDVPCPHLHITSQDEDGNLYFSNGQGSIASAVLDDDQPRNCVARIRAGETTIDEAFTTDFASMTEGREGSNFFYVGDGVALINVYHAERDDLAADTPFESVDYSSSYHLWTVDVATMQAHPIDGVGYTGGQFVAFHIDDRTIVAIPSADYSTTSVYEVLSTGAIEKRFDTGGWTFKMFRVR